MYLQKGRSLWLYHHHSSLVLGKRSKPVWNFSLQPLRSDQDSKTARNGCNISLQESTGCPFFLIVTAGELKRESDFFIHTRIPRYSAAAHLHITYQPMSSTLCQLGQQPGVTERCSALRPFVCSATISISNSWNPAWVGPTKVSSVLFRRSRKGGGRGRCLLDTCSWSFSLKLNTVLLLLLQSRLAIVLKLSNNVWIPPLRYFYRLFNDRDKIKCS